MKKKLKVKGRLPDWDQLAIEHGHASHSVTFWFVVLSLLLPSSSPRPVSTCDTFLNKTEAE
jgi:hypothetical protein